jgi:hypothetical protein
VQLVYKSAVLKGLKLDLSNAESTTDSWATGPSAGLAIRFLGSILATASIVFTNLSENCGQRLKLAELQS